MLVWIISQKLLAGIFIIINTEHNISNIDILKSHL